MGEQEKDRCDIRSMKRDELLQYIGSLGEKPFRARQL